MDRAVRHAGCPSGIWGVTQQKNHIGVGTDHGKEKPVLTKEPFAVLAVIIRGSTLKTWSSANYHVVGHQVVRPVGSLWYRCGGNLVVFLAVGSKSIRIPSPSLREEGHEGSTMFIKPGGVIRVEWKPVLQHFTWQFFSNDAKEGGQVFVTDVSGPIIIGFRVELPLSGSLDNRGGRGGDGHGGGVYLQLYKWYEDGKIGLQIY
jgi:hypothetical protein